jgi:hypothetical protein
MITFPHIRERGGGDDLPAPRTSPNKPRRRLEVPARRGRTGRTARVPGSDARYVLVARDAAADQLVPDGDRRLLRHDLVPPRVHGARGAPRAAVVPAVRRGRLPRRRVAERHPPRLTRGHVQPVRVRRDRSRRPRGHQRRRRQGRGTARSDRIRPGRLRRQPTVDAVPDPPGEGDRAGQGTHDRRDASAGLADLVPVRRQLGRHLGQRRAHRASGRPRRSREGVHEDRREEGLARRRPGQARRDGDRGGRRHGPQHDRRRRRDRPAARGRAAELPRAIGRGRSSSSPAGRPTSSC